MYVSGIRWYRAFPTQLTQLVIASNNALWTGGDPNSTFPYASLNALQSFNGQSATAPVSFAPVRDPAANNGNGSDVLVICGFTGAYGFATCSLSVGTFAAGDTFAVKMVNGGTTVTTSNYTVLATDVAVTIAQNLAELVNESTAVTTGTPFLGQSYQSGQSVMLGALVSGAAGNSYTAQIIRNGSGVGSPTTFTGGGNTSSAPLKYDGSTVSGLGYQISQPFTGCVAWHNHVWLWGDPSYPDTLFACDINQPEGFTFMIKNGGYEIGAGESASGIRAVVPIGNILYVFKADSIYAITGYDFQSGDYQFQIAPAVRGIGTVSQESVAVLENALIFWSGARFYRLSVGAFEAEYIGATIPFTQGIAANGNANLVRAVGGSFAARSNLNESFTGTSDTSGWEIYDQVALFAVDTGSGSANTILVYDEAASNKLGNYAWSKWTGFNVGAWIPFGHGPSVSGTPIETPLLCWVDAATAVTPIVYAYGTDPMADSGRPISFLAQTGWVTLDTGALQKELHRIFLEMEATLGVVFSFTITPSVTSTQSGNPKLYDSFRGAFGGTGGAAGAESHQTLTAMITPALRANAFIFAFGENSAVSGYELVELTLDYIQEAFNP